VTLPASELPERETSPDAVARHLRGLIVGGTLRRGDRVPQDEIAARLGMSRIPVREAIIALEHEGWLTVEAHRGAFVHGVDEAWVADHYELMGALYALVAARAAERGSGPEVVELRRLAAELAGEHDIDRFVVVNDRLVRLLVAMARSPRLEAALRDVPDIVPGNFFAEVPGTAEPERLAMTETVRAVVESDPSGAAERIRRLTARQGAAVVARLRARGVIDSVETSTRGTPSG